MRQRWLRNDFFGANASLKYTDDVQTVTIGAFASRYQGRSFGRVVWASLAQLPGNEYEYYTSPSVKEEVSLFARYTRKLSQSLSATADVQGRGISYRFSGTDNDQKTLDFSKNWFFFNPKIGFERQQGRSKTTLFAGITHREPTRSNITDARAGHPTPERLYNLELGHQLNGNNYHLGANLFYMHYQNQLVLTGELNDVGNPIMQNVAVSYRRGLELDGQWQPHPRVRLMGTATFMQTAIEKFSARTPILDDNYLPVGDSLLTFQNEAIAFSPALLATGTVQVQVFKNITVELTGRYVGRQYLDNTEKKTRSLDPYTLADARLAWQPELKGIKMLRLTAQAINLFSRQYESNGYTGFTLNQAGGQTNYNAYYPQAPLSLLVGVELGF